jgi:hypothetical protein
MPRNQLPRRHPLSEAALLANPLKELIMELIVIQINVTLALLLGHCMLFVRNRWAYARRTRTG